MGMKLSMIYSQNLITNQVMKLMQGKLPINQSINSDESGMQWTIGGNSYIVDSHQKMME